MKLSRSDILILTAAITVAAILMATLGTETSRTLRTPPAHFAGERVIR
jgi:hypothetical protein